MTDLGSGLELVNKEAVLSSGRGPGVHELSIAFPMMIIFCPSFDTKTLPNTGASLTRGLHGTE